MTHRVRNIAIASVLAILAGLLVVFYLGRSNDEQKQAQELVTTYVATKDIPVGAKGDEVTSKLEATEVARDSVTPGAITSPDEVRKLVVTQPIYEGEQVTTSRFVAAKQSGVIGAIAGNQRAIQLAGDTNQLLVGTLKRGDRVDLVATINYQVDDLTDSGEVANTRDRVATRVVLRDIRVIEAPELAEDDAALQDSSGQASYSVLLAVTDREVEKLFFVTSNDRNQWTLQLRPVTGAKDSTPGIQTVESVLGDGLGLGDIQRLIGGRGTR